MTKQLKIIIEKIKRLEPLTHAEKQEYIRYSITTHAENGKLADFQSISTSCLDCENCNKRFENKKFICSTCYARRELTRKKTLREKMHVNTIFYTNYKIVDVDVPLLNVLVFRFESLGEIQNILQVRNYFTICRKNPQIYFVLWSKEYKRIAAAIAAGENKPDNLGLIASSYFVNPVNPETVLKKYPYIDRVFCVFSGDYIAQNNIEINCKSHCRDCMICYTPGNGITVINEKKK